MNLKCPFIAATSSGAMVSSEDEFFTHHDGHQIPVEYWGHPMKRDDELVGCVVTFIDISRRKTLEKQLLHSQRMEAIGTLTGGIAHDFNNILTVISGYVGLLRSQFSDNPKLLSQISKIGEAAERGSQLTHGLLAYSRKKSEPSTTVDLNRLVLNVQNIFGEVIGEQIDLNLDLSEQQLVVLAESSQFEQVLVNLATNARDAMYDGGVLSIKTEQIELDQNFCQNYGYGHPGAYALISVADCGIGIPKEIQQKIFDPFFTTKDTGKGTGLGLAMVWGIVKQHNGYILLDSIPGAGSCFKIYLPLTTQPLPLQVEAVNSLLPGGDEIILLVEDDPLVRESTRAILTTVGYRVVSSDCAESALKILDQEESDLSLILSDVVMPGLKGAEFYHEIRKRTATPVVFISGYTFDSLREQGLVGEGVTLLNKPIEPVILLTRIREILDSG
jgi:signal transduction histidine kinase/CheY-like chemotaxis protein